MFHAKNISCEQPSLPHVTRQQCFPLTTLSLITVFRVRFTLTTFPHFHWAFTGYKDLFSSVGFDPVFQDTEFWHWRVKKPKTPSASVRTIRICQYVPAEKKQKKGKSLAWQTGWRRQVLSPQTSSLPSLASYPFTRSIPMLTLSVSRKFCCQSVDVRLLFTPSRSRSLIRKCQHTDTRSGAFTHNCVLPPQEGVFYFGS